MPEEAHAEAARPPAGDRPAPDEPARAHRRTALLVSPSLAGHRVVYCRVIAGILGDEGCDVALAAAPRRDQTDPLLDDLLARPGVALHDITGDLRGRSLPPPALTSLAGRVGAAVTVLCEADDLLDELAEARNADLPSGRLVGLFVRSTNEQYAQPSLLRRVRTRARAAGGAQARRAAALRGFVRGRLVDASLVLDERFALQHPSHLWLPDVYREQAPPSVAEAAETTEWRRRVREFLAAARPGPVVVYVGTNQQRRGYDTLLRLALAEDGVFLHCGRFAPEHEPSDAEVERLRAELGSRGALLETGGRYLSADTAAAFLQAARVVVLPYRGHDGSSGVMLQALAAGRRVLVPDRGLMAYRARTFGVGATFRDGSSADLRRRFRAMCAVSPDADAGRLEAFMAYFSPDQVAAAVRAAVGSGGPGARVPRGLEGRPSGRAHRGGD